MFWIMLRCIILFSIRRFSSGQDAGKPCPNLQTTSIVLSTKKLSQQGLKGCTAYDCFGAGQKVAQVTYGGRDWRQGVDVAKQMFEVFLIMRQLHEMLWYLTEVSALQVAHSIQDKITSIINETIRLTHLSPDSLIGEWI